MLVIETIPLLHRELHRWRQRGQRIALVPTMGNLHAGHIALVEAAREQAERVVVSIFVNPLQFEHADDLARYPRTLQQDGETLNRHGVDIVFAPDAAVICPQKGNAPTFVEVPQLSSVLEGASRPGHFRGVATIVSKLFNLIQPDLVCFGEKDYQQLALVRQMITDLCYQIEIVAVPTVRAEDGLALSSRNCFLTAHQRQQAPALHRVMNRMAQKLAKGEPHVQQIIAHASAELTQSGFQPDGLAICDAETLQPLSTESRRAVILLAGWLGSTRLIDNQQVTLTQQIRQGN